MIFEMGSSCFSHSPLFHSLSPSSSTSCSSSLYSSQPVFLYSFPRNGSDSRRKNRTPKASSVHRGGPNHSVSCKRRAILLLGISVVPFLQLNAKALQGLEATEGLEIQAADQKQKTEQTVQGDASKNPSLSLLNGLGIFSSGVLGALYALARKEKIAAEAAVESMTNKMNEKEATIVSLEKSFELKLLKEKDERNKQLKKAIEEQQSLLNQLNSANSTITGLRKELLNEKRLVENLNIQIENLRTNLSEAGEEKKELEEKMKEKLNLIEVLQERMTLVSSEIKDKEDTLSKLNSSLAEKDSELKKLSSSYEKTKNELAGANSEIGGLKQEILKNGKELELKNMAVNDLNAQVSSLTVERDDSIRKFDAFQKEYNNMKSSSLKKAAADAKLLGEKDDEIQQLRGKINVASKEVSENRVLAAKLTQEKDNLRKSLDIELNNVKNMKNELQITQEALGKSRHEVSDLAKQLQNARNLCSSLESEISRVTAEFSEAKESFDKNLVEAKRSAEVLSSELASAKEAQKKTEDELNIVSRDLAAAVENRDSLKKELVDVYKRAENAVRDLKEEKKVVTSLTKDLQALEKQIAEHKESRKSLETDLEEATKSLAEMNPKAMALARDLEIARSQISSLEEEKDVIYNSLLEQQRVSQDEKESLEDAHNLVMRLGKERETLEKRGKKLEEDFAAAKGEILRLRSLVNSSKSIVNDQPPNPITGTDLSSAVDHKIKKPIEARREEKLEAGGNAAVSVKKNGRRRKGVPQQDN